jgi:primosomal protein N' (replication factor Y)
MGTQKAEEEIKRLFPQGRMFRLDADSASKKGVYQKVYEDFKKEDFDILLGTQMVVKGFDFPRVTFVGVLDADTALYLPDFRSAERTFQLITQAAGRCGRSDMGGEVVVQSRHTGHYALAAAQKHDYHEFYKQEIEFRRQLHYPPFCRLLNILIRGKNEEKVADAAKIIGEDLQRLKKEKALTVEILGPAPASRTKLHNMFRWQMLLKGSIAELLSVAKAVKERASISGILTGVDVDPQDTL